jgi:putative salt-induced outer membrane protein YdiY
VKIILLILGALLLIDTSTAVAGEVTLHNGDRLTGDIVKMEDKTLTVKTPYAGEVMVDWNQIQSVKSDVPLAIRPRTGREASVPAPLLATELTADGPIPLSEIHTINVDPLRYTGHVTVGGTRTSGNTNTASLAAASLFSMRTDRHRLNLEARYNYGEANNHPTARNTTESAGYNFFFDEKLYATAQTLLEKDTFQNLNLRLTVGSGLGYQFFDRKAVKLGAELGLAHVNQHFTTVPSTETMSLRWSLRWDQDVLADRLKLYHLQEVYRDFDVQHATRVRADQGLKLMLYQNLFVNFEYYVRYNSRPAPDRKTMDETFVVGLGYDFK